jgi:glucuronate isomerase
MLLHEDRLLPAEPGTRKIAKALYERVKTLPIVSPHGHTQAVWFAKNEPFPGPAELFVQPDHYVFRMLYSQGISMEDLEIGRPEMKDARKVWRIFAKNYYLFRGTPTRIWLDFAFQELFGLEERLSEKTADLYFDAISAKLRTPEFLPRALYERFNLEVLATTDSPLDSLADHKAIRASGWKARIIPNFRPDPVVDAEFKGFAENIRLLGEQTGEDTATWAGYLNALRKARARFIELGCTATDHGHPTAQTADLPKAEAAELFRRVLGGSADLAQQELFRAQMLTEMAQMSLEDGLVMQIHPGSVRNHNRKVYERYGRDVGCDIPRATNYVDALRPLLDHHSLHAGRIYLQPGVGSAGGALSLPEAWTALVVSRQPGRNDAFPRTDDRDGGFLQYGGFQRRHQGLPFHSGAARCGAARGLRLLGEAGRRTPAGRGRGIRGGPRPYLRIGKEGVPAVRSLFGLAAPACRF